MPPAGHPAFLQYPQSGRVRKVQEFLGVRPIRISSAQEFLGGMKSLGGQKEAVPEKPTFLW